MFRTQKVLNQIILFFTVMLIGSITVISSQAKTLDHKGKEFLLSFLPNLEDGEGSKVQLHLSSDVSTTVTIEYPVNAPTFTTTVAVVPGAITIVDLPLSARSAWSIDSVNNNSVRAYAEDEFVCSLANILANSSEAALGLPVDTMNTQYVVMDYNPKIQNSDFAVYAAYDNTTVSITPSTDLIGRSAGAPFSITLNRGEAYFGRSATLDPGNTLTGTLISSDRPVGLVNGNGCTPIPTSSISCDHIFEVAPPVQTWGMRVLVANLPNRPNGTVYRIVASEDGTTVTQNDSFLVTLDRGEFHEIGPITGNHEFEADRPILVTQYMTTKGVVGNTVGDPAMGTMIPVEQFSSTHTFLTIDNYFNTHFLTLFAENADVDTIALDGNPVGASNFTAIGTSGFSVAVLPLAEGTHTTQSNGVHGIVLEGYNTFDSYVYPGGGSLRFINPSGDENPPVCHTSLSGQPPVLAGTVSDNQSAEESGIFFVELLADSSNLTLSVDPFVPGDEQVSFFVELIDISQMGSGTVLVSDGSGNTCEIPVELSSNQPPIAVCQDSALALDANGDATLTPDLVDGGSSDPDGDNIFLSVSPNQFSCGDLGEQEVTLTVTDNDGLTDTCTAIVTVLDLTPPIITLNGEDTIMLQVNVDSYSEAGAEANDACDQDVPVSISGVIDTSQVGTYILSYDAVDDSGNAAETVTRTVIVQDTVSPVIFAALTPVEVEEEEGLFRVEFGCLEPCDPSPSLIAAELNGIPVEYGQTVYLELNEEIDVDYEDDLLKIEAPAFELVVVFEDAFGNLITEQATPEFAPDDDDGDDDDNDDGKGSLKERLKEKLKEKLKDRKKDRIRKILKRIFQGKLRVWFKNWLKNHRENGNHETGD